MNLKFTALFAGRSDDDNDPNDPDSAAAKEEQRKEDDEKLLEIMEALSDETRESLETFKLRRAELERSERALIRDFEHCRQNYIEAQRQESLARDAVTLATDDVRKAEVEHKVRVEDYKKSQVDIGREGQKLRAERPDLDDRDTSAEELSTPDQKNVKLSAQEKYGAAIDAKYAAAGVTKEWAVLKELDQTKNNPILSKISAEDRDKAIKAVKAAGLHTSPDDALFHHIKNVDPQNPYLNTLSAQHSDSNNKAELADKAGEFLAEKNKELSTRKADHQTKINVLKEAQSKFESAESELAKIEKKISRIDKAVAELGEFQKRLPELKQGLKDKTITPEEFMQQMPENMREDFLEKNPALRKTLEKAVDAPAPANAIPRQNVSESAANKVYGDQPSEKSLTSAFTRANTPAADAPSIAQAQEHERKFSVAQNQL